MARSGWIDAETAHALFNDDPEKILARYRKAVEAAPDDERGYCGVALALWRMGRHQDIADCMRDLIRVRPDAAYAHGFMGAAVEKKGAHKDAMACYERMLEIGPDDAAARFRRGLLMYPTGRTKNNKYYWKELAAEPGSEIAGRIQDVIRTSVMNATEEGPSGNGPIIMTPGMIQMLGVLITGSENGLLEPFVRTLEAGSQDPDFDYRPVISKYVEEIASAGAGRDPDLADDLLEKASELADGGRFAEAAEVAGEVIAADPGFADAHSARATFLAKTGRYEEALESTDRCWS